MASEMSKLKITSLQATLVPFPGHRRKHLNVDGVEDYSKKYGTNILDICESQSPSRSLSGSTLDVIKEAMERKVLECQKEVERE